MSDDIKVTGDALLDLRRCVEHLRAGLTESLYGNSNQLDHARLLNQTTAVARAYKCYPQHLAAGAQACHKGKGDCSKVLADKRCFGCPANAGVVLPRDDQEDGK
jgi:hypothetical protein